MTPVQSLSSGQASRATISENGVGSNSSDIVANHLFADNVRFLSMAAIIGMHTVEAYGMRVQRGSFPALLYGVIQPLKFGTIAFFLVAGFLFGERIDHVRAHEYFLRRLRNVFLPWCFWVSLWCIVRASADLVTGQVAEFDPKYLIHVVTFYSMDGAYWFVPNLLIALALLLILRRYLRDIRVGLLFLAASLFYSVNIYGHWITVVHTHAVFGFIFYLWLGAWAAWHYSELEKLLARIPAGAMIGLVIAALGLSFAESEILFKLDSIDPVNTLRVTNQVYSVVAVLALLKLKHAVWPKFVHVREHTFGIYLTHTVAISFFVRALWPMIQYLRVAPRWALWTGTAVLLPAMYAMVYGSSLLVVRILLSYSKLRWMVGLPLKKQAKATGRLAILRPHSHSGHFVAR